MWDGNRSCPEGLYTPRYTSSFLTCSRPDLDPVRSLNDNTLEPTCPSSKEPDYKDMLDWHTWLGPAQLSINDSRRLQQRTQF